MAMSEASVEADERSVVMRLAAKRGPATHVSTLRADGLGWADKARLLVAFARWLDGLASSDETDDCAA